MVFKCVAGRVVYFILFMLILVTCYDVFLYVWRVQAEGVRLLYVYGK